ncbi:hypothetical protein C9890_0597 [Perkinsus sp. BL_2016]|nr:hypothetical protein C9890_0597 [Perkinsus sp. BL_2016]
MPSSASETVKSVEALVELALNGNKSDRNSAEKTFEKLLKADEVHIDMLSSLCNRLFGQSGEDETSDVEVDSESEESDEAEIELPGVLDQSVLAGHNEDIVLDDLNVSSFSLLQILMEDEEELVGSHSVKNSDKRKLGKREQQELRTTQMRVLRLLDLILTRKHFYTNPQLTVDVGVSLLTFALDSADDEVSMKLITCLDHHWRKHAPGGVEVSDMENTVTELLALISHHRSLTGTALSIVGRVFAKILEYLPPVQELINDHLLLWAQNKLFRYSSGLPFFQGIVNLDNTIWPKLINQTVKTFRLKELVELISWKSLDYLTIQSLAGNFFTQLATLAGSQVAKDKPSVAIAKDLIKILVNSHPKTHKGLLTDELKTLLDSQWKDVCTQVVKNLLAVDMIKPQNNKRKSEEGKKQLKKLKSE